MLVSCPECGKKISSKAVACPNCGHPGPFAEAGKEKAPGAARPEEHPSARVSQTPPPVPSAARETSRKSLKRIVAIVLAGGLILEAFAGSGKPARPPSGLASAVLPNEQISSLDEQAARALFNKGVTLGRQGKPDAEIAVYDEIDRRFGQDASAGMREQVARALGNKGCTLGQQGQPDAAIAVYDEVDRRFGQDDSPGVRERVARALLYKGGNLLELQGKPHAAIAAFDEVARRFGQDDSPGVRKWVAWALYYKGVTLERQGNPDAAIAVHDEIERRFGQDASPDVRERVAEARAEKQSLLASRKARK
ncbi:MAG: tetratricopeptide repeat protein [Candidatus Accumulibacter sp.]|jgi:tetratricopeptide (TPR) repeat protein|nr:tetratricopeptide repeat protein [Accumulibacter sp.]